MKLEKGMRVKVIKGEYVGIITDVSERGVAGSDVTYISKVEITYDNGLVYKCDPSMCVLAEALPQQVS
jgi:hypothetical protein